MGKPINENPNPAPRMNAPVVQLNPSSEVAALRERCEKAEAERDEAKKQSDELNDLFDLQYNADCRATKRWRESHPDSPTVLPDRCDMVVWLIGKLEKAEARAERLAAYVRAIHAREDAAEPSEYADPCGDEWRAYSALWDARESARAAVDAHRDLEGGAA